MFVNRLVVSQPAGMKQIHFRAALLNFEMVLANEFAFFLVQSVFDMLWQHFEWNGVGWKGSLLLDPLKDADKRIARRMMVHSNHREARHYVELPKAIAALFIRKRQVIENREF